MDEVEGDNVGLVNVISNSVIIRRLEKYISYDDFKACRLVCRAFNRGIVDESSFSTRTKLIVKEDTFRSGIFSQLSFTLKNVDLYFFDQDPALRGILYRREKLPKLTEDELEPIYHCFSSVESLKSHDELLRSENFTEVLPDVNRLIRATESLKELQMSTWDVILLLNLEHSEEVNEKLKDVVSLELIPYRDLVTYALYKKGLAEVNKLQRVKIRDGYTASTQATEDVSATFRAMGELVVRSADTVTSLKISESYLWAKFSDADTNYICDTHFPKLRKLRIRARDDQAVEISSFLAAHGKQLDSLGIRILGEFPCDMIDVIRQEASKKIKKLTIATKGFDQSRPRNLAFLEDCQELESFKLQFIFSKTYDPNCDSVTDVFSFLPTKNLRKLSLIRLPTPWSNESLDHLKIEALSGLRYLALDWCEKAVNDDTINAIFKSMTQLEYLRIKHAKCGVKGFTGTENVEDPTPDPGKVAASNLTNLKHLVLQHCGLDDHIIKVALKFKHLEMLDICENLDVTTASCRVVVSQNPALKVLRTGEFLDDYIEESELKRLNARFQSYEILFGSFGDHDIDSSDEDDDSSISNPEERWWGHEDSDEDPDEFDFMGDGGYDDYDGPEDFDFLG